MRARTSCRSSSGATRRATTWGTRPPQQVALAPPSSCSSPTPSPLPPQPPIPDPKQPPTQTTPPNPTRASTPPDRRHPTDRRPTAAAAHRRPEGAGGEQLAGEAVQDRRQPGSLLRHRAARAGEHRACWAQTSKPTTSSRAAPRRLQSLRHRRLRHRPCPMASPAVGETRVRGEGAASSGEGVGVCRRASTRCRPCRVAASTLSPRGRLSRAVLRGAQLQHEVHAVNERRGGDAAHRARRARRRPARDR